MLSSPKLRAELRNAEEENPGDTEVILTAGSALASCIQIGTGSNFYIEFSIL
jgi:hypothetical protein